MLIGEITMDIQVIEKGIINLQQQKVEDQIPVQFE